MTPPIRLDYKHVSLGAISKISVSNVPKQMNRCVGGVMTPPYSILFEKEILV